MNRPPATPGTHTKVAIAITLPALCCLVVLALPGTSTAASTPPPTPTAGPTGTGTTTSGSTSILPPVSPVAAPPAPTGLPTPTITASAPSDVPATTPTTVTATITGATTSNEIIRLSQQTGDSWKVVASALIGDDNTAMLSITQGTPAAYSYRLDLSATTQHKAANSNTVTVNVGAAPTATPSPTPTPTDGPTTPPPPRLCGGVTPYKDDGTPWVCTYDDEFNGDSLDRRYWTPQLSVDSGVVTGTTAQPACYIDDPRTIAETGGNLELHARVLDSPVGCGKVSTNEVSGGVTHTGTFSQTYGKYEVRAKLPAALAKGLQETFWLWPVDSIKYGLYHPSSGEIDFAESYSTYPTITVPVMHYVLDPSTINFTTNTNIYTAYTCAIHPGDFNTYGLEWSPGLMKIFVNGTVCIINHYSAYNAPPGSPYAPFDSPFFLALTQLFGASGNEFDAVNGPKYSATLIDYVRVWQ